MNGDRSKHHVSRIAAVRTRTLVATYRIVTPMFCAGADQQSAELRLPSFKGALRFWWRTLMWGKVNDHNELRRREADLFGSSDAGTGQSKVRLRICSSQLAAPVNPPSVFENGTLPGAHYLGYGVMEAFGSRKKGTRAGQLTRAMIPSGEFSVECRLSASATRDQLDEVRKALILLGTVGGLGAKSRKGFGSITITELQNPGPPIDLTTPPQDRLKNLLRPNPEADDWPAWTAWSKHSRLLIATANCKRAVELLDRLGREEVFFRSWGHEGMVFGQPAERNFPHDYYLWKRRPVEPKYPYRLAFGLPHNYGKKPEDLVHPEQHDRRASPLFIHIDQQDAKHPPVAVLAFLPSQLLPRNEDVMAFGAPVNLATDDTLWFPIHAFLDRLLNGGTIPQPRVGYDRFPAENEWWRKKTDIHAEEIKLV
ncbi:MAG: type III-B CRISPR module RAMP protein Cmr1 [Planctomycetota bacterium]|nr:MAG: type III-B CRISPR module RAMP protein Cmr1 [Planctomycetota bacterium]